MKEMKRELMFKVMKKVMNDRKKQKVGVKRNE